MATATLRNPMESTGKDTPALQPSVLERIAEGDTSAVDECLEKYGALVWSLAGRYTASRDDAEDATQEVFVAIWQQAERFDPTRASETTFVSMIARRRLIDRLRKQSKAPDVISFDEASTEITFHQADTAEMVDEARKAKACFGKLNENQKSVLSLSIHEGYSHQRIATALRMPLGTVKSFARRSLLQLRECMNRSSLPQSDGGAS